MSVRYPDYEFQYITDKKLRDYLDKYSPGQNKIPLSVMLDMAVSGSPNSVSGNIYVNTDLADNGNGSLGRPYNNFADANAASAFGDTIVVLNNCVLSSLPLVVYRTYDFTGHYIILNGHITSSGAGLLQLKNALIQISYSGSPCWDITSEISVRVSNFYGQCVGGGQPFIRLNANLRGTSGVSFGCGIQIDRESSLESSDDSPILDCTWGSAHIDGEIHSQDVSAVVIRRGQLFISSTSRISNESATHPTVAHLGGIIEHKGAVENSDAGGGILQIGYPLPEPATFVGAAGLNDLTASGTFYGTTFTVFKVKIDGTGAPDSFKWSYDGGATWYATGVNITGGVQTLMNGAQIQFASTVGHNIDDEWTIWALPSGLIVTIEYVPAGLLNDLTVSGNYTGTASNDYVVMIDGNGPDTFKWSRDGGSTWMATTVAITGAAQLLELGVSVTIAATTGHRIGDSWTFSAGRNGLTTYMGCVIRSGGGGNSWSKDTAEAIAFIVPFSGSFDASFDHHNIVLGIGATSAIIGVPPGVTPILTSQTPGQIGEVVGTGLFMYCGGGAATWEALL